jgi:hypothetical protein
MKKLVFALLVGASAAILAPGSGYAQTAPALVKVPFNFIVGDVLLPAGSYRIAADTQDSSLLVITRTNGKPGAFAVTGRMEGRASTDAQVHVAFKNVDGRYFLWTVAMPGGDWREIAVTRAQAERTLARLNLLAAEPSNVTK